MGKEGQEIKWVFPKELNKFPMPDADKPLIPFLRDLL
jgi:8-oxo-dGTP diphosphatase